jgi:hypothetical protein
MGTMINNLIVGNKNFETAAFIHRVFGNLKKALIVKYIEFMISEIEGKMNKSKWTVQVQKQDLLNLDYSKRWIMPIQIINNKNKDIVAFFQFDKEFYTAPLYGISLGNNFKKSAGTGVYEKIKDVLWVDNPKDCRATDYCPICRDFEHSIWNPGNYEFLFKLNEFASQNDSDNKNILTDKAKKTVDFLLEQMKKIDESNVL